jgi:flagellar basal-body rod protein FlgF
MDRLVYIASATAARLETAQAVAANNLANASTTGFKADLLASRAALLQGDGWDSRVYAPVTGAGMDASAGAVNPTGRDLDLAIDGEGALAVQAADGAEAYTRAGNLRVSASGLLETASGLPVLGDGGPLLIPPYQSISIGRDGTVSVVPDGQGPEAQAVVGRIKLVNPPPDSLQKGGDGTLRPAGGGTLPADAAVRLTPGALEGSNVSAVGAMVQMIETSRQYELQVRLMQAAEKADQASSRLLSLNG